MSSKTDLNQGLLDRQACMILLSTQLTQDEKSEAFATMRRFADTFWGQTCECDEATLYLRPSRRRGKLTFDVRCIHCGN